MSKNKVAGPAPNPVPDHEAETRRKAAIRQQVLDRLWELARLSPETTRGSATSQVKAVAMIVAIEGLIPDRRAAAKQPPAAPAVRPDFYEAEWMREQKARLAAEPAAQPLPPDPPLPQKKAPPAVTPARPKPAPPAPQPGAPVSHGRSRGRSHDRSDDLRVDLSEDRSDGFTDDVTDEAIRLAEQSAAYQQLASSKYVSFVPGTRNSNLFGCNPFRWRR